LKVLYVYADSKEEWNCSEWNCIIPTKAINRTKNHTANAIYINEFIENTENSQKLCSEADIIVVERNYFGDTLTIIQFWKSRGKTVIGIFDDAYDIMHHENISYRFWTHGEVNLKDPEGKEVKGTMKPHPLTQFKWGHNILKGLQVPSVNLQKDWSKYNPNTYYVHNYLDIEKYMNVEQLYPHQKEDILIGWCGSLSHHSSFTGSGVLDALKRICKNYENVTVLISGDKRIYDLLEVKKKLFQPFVPPEKWTPLLKSLDIGLAPLSGEYDKRRSWIKALEYMALKVPFVATDYPTYSELREYGKMTENGYRPWLDSLTEVIENYPAYKEKAENEGYQFALSQSSDANIEKVTLKLYQKFINMPYPIHTYGDSPLTEIENCGIIENQGVEECPPENQKEKE